MRDGSLGEGGIAVFRGGTVKANDQIFNQLWKMSCALVVAERKVVEFAALFRPSQPVCDDIGNGAMQYLGDPLLFQSGNRFAGEHLIVDEFREPSDIERFHDDFVSLQK